jgi:hypothetical protein
VSKLVALTVSVVAVLAAAPPAHAEEACKRAAIVPLVGVTWEMVAEHQPERILEVAREGALGSVSVRTNSARTSYASGYATISAGTRADGGRTSGGVAGSGGPYSLSGRPAEHLVAGVQPTGIAEIVDSAQDADYEPRLGSLASALSRGQMIAVGNGDPGIDPPSPLGLGRHVLLAAVERDGSVAAAAVGPELLRSDPSFPWGARTDNEALLAAVDEALEVPCSVVIVDQGDLMRVDSEARSLERPPDPAHLQEALHDTDEVVGHLRARLDPERDLLLLVSVTSPWWEADIHLGVAVARGPGFPAGSGLESASTRQADIVTLPDIAPTVLRHLGIERPPGMIGRSFVPIEGRDRRVERAITLDRESVFAHRTQPGVSTGFVLVQIALYGVALWVLRQRQPLRGPPSRRATSLLEIGGLAIAAFPFVSYLQSPIPAHDLGTGWFVAVLLVMDAALVALVVSLFGRPLERLLAITAATTALFFGDLLLGTNLQLNAVWGNDPIVAGRFTGLGNIAFAVLGTSSLMTGALLIHRWPESRRVYPAVAVLFAGTVIVDGAPAWGSDVGGVLALVPALTITWVMLTGRRPSAKAIVVGAVGSLVVLGVFLAIDLARPSSERTHLGRLWEDVDERGTSVFVDTIERKIRTNLRVFRSTIWTYLVPPALAIVAVLLLRPRGRWRRLAQRYPRLRAGLIGGLLLGILGFVVNDSGIVVPGMVLSFLAPAALLLHLTLERESAGEPAT